MPRPKQLTSKQVGIKYGFRSGLEDAIQKQLTSKKIGYEYEEHKLKYTKPEKPHTYTPDFYIYPPSKKGKPLIIESKGRFVTADRQKMKLIKEQYPDLDIRFVFSNSRARISKQSKTTYGMWCKKHGFQYADKLIPEDWLK